MAASAKERDESLMPTRPVYDARRVSFVQRGSRIWQSSRVKRRANT
jgi:fibrillarin-like rRNA methylase